MRNRQTFNFFNPFLACDLVWFLHDLNNFLREKSLYFFLSFKHLLEWIILIGLWCLFHLINCLDLLNFNNFFHLFLLSFILWNFKYCWFPYLFWFLIRTLSRSLYQLAYLNFLLLLTWFNWRFSILKLMLYLGTSGSWGSSW